MNSDVAEIALMYVLPLGVTFITILQTAASEYRSQKLAGAFLSLIVVVLDCLFYFSKNSLIAYNNAKGEDLVPVEADCRFSTNALFRLGFVWPIIDDAYLKKVIWALDTLGFFDAMF